MTVRKSILLYIAKLLAGVPNATVYRSREEALARDEGIGIVVKPEEEESENRAMGGPTGLVMRNFTAVITIIARASGVASSQTPDDIADPIQEAAHALLMADTTLGGRCSTLIEHSTKWDFEQADGTALAAEMRYVVRYMTNAKTLSASI